MEQYFDAIVIGAGPAGSTAALKMARAGLKIALLERGAYPGCKNIFGGILHNSPALNQLLPEFWKKAPVERYVYRKTLAVATPASSITLNFATENFEQHPYNGFTVMRPVFDRWLANEAVKEGALLLCNCLVDDLVQRNGKICGVKVKGRNGDIIARVVVAADGVLSFAAEKAGLRKELRPAFMGLGIKLLLSLPEEVINERFGLIREQGADFSILGITEGLKGGAFLYTNQESISFGMVIHLDSLKASGNASYEILNKALQHPLVRKLVRGAVPVEYSAHLVPEGGIRGIPRLYTDGMLVAGDAAGLCYTNGINLEGINLAIVSGALAAETIIEAARSGDFSRDFLSLYQKKLENSFVLKDMKTFSNAFDMLQIDRLYQTYPELLCSVFEAVYRVTGTPRERIFKLLRKKARGKIHLINLISDGIKAARGLL